MENFSCAEGRPPDGGIPEFLMVGDGPENDYDLDFEGQCGESEGAVAGDMGSTYDHVDIETCDLPMAEAQLNQQQPHSSSQPESTQDTEEETEDEKEPLSYDLAQGHRILAEIMSDANKSLNWPFMDPVDAEGMGLNDYHERVKEPMWLRKILIKFDERVYETITEFARDFRRMLENCYRYNGPDHYVSKRGQKLETVFEQKLGLLSRELREKTSIAATSGKPIEHKIITGTRRRKVLAPHDSSDLLNQLRLEEKERERESRKQLVEERKQQQQAAVQELIDWEDHLLGPGGRDCLYAMWELPQIGHFLFLTGSVLNTGEIMQWELERGFWMPRQSSQLHVIMTSLLSTPYQRTRLDSKPPMPYNVWEDKLRTRVRNWYKIFNENNRDTKKTHRKIGIEEMFFKVAGLTNPMEKRKFHEITFYQRVWIVKSLCDWCLSTQESVQEALESQSLQEQRQYPLGTDADGNSYIHFPQFCGQDLRIYKVAPVQMPKTPRPNVKKEEKPVQKTPYKRKGGGRRGRGRAKQSNVRVISSHSDSNGSSSDSGINESESSDIEPPISKSRRRSPAVSRDTEDNSIKPSSAANTPTKGRSSRTSAAARGWLPRDVTLIADLSGKRGTRSQRLACPVGSNSGTSTPTTTATPSGSRESTPAPMAEPSSRSSTPSLDVSSQASSPSKLPSSQTSSIGSRRRRQKAPQRRKNLAAVQSVEKGKIDTKGVGSGSTGKADSADVGSSRDQENQAKNDIPDAESTRSSSPVSKTKTAGSSNMDMEPNDEPAMNGQGTYPFSSYSTDDKVKNGQSDCVSDTKLNCDMDSNSTVEQQETMVKVVQNGSSPAESGNDGQKEGPAKSLSRCESLKGSSFDGDNSENQFYICKCEGVNSVSESGMSVVSKSGAGDGACHCNNACIKANTNAETTNVIPQSGIKTEPIDDGDSMLMSNEQFQNNDAVTIKVEPCSDTEVKMETNDIEIKQEPADETLNTAIKQEILPEAVVEGAVKQEPVYEEIIEGEIKTEPIVGQTPGGEEAVKEENSEGAGSTETVVKQEEVELEPEIKVPEIGPFRLMADSVELLRSLSLLFAEPEPIIEIKGKKEKIIRPPPRKKCVSELYERLTYLLKELEPWESKLVAANKKARLKLRKELESYVEEKEIEVFEDVWESEESQSEDSDENEDIDNEDAEVQEIFQEPVKVVKPVASVSASPSKSNPKTPKKSPIVIPEIELRIASSDPEKSSYGRVRKRKVIPNAYDEPVVNKKKKGKDEEHSPSPTPNILASSRTKKASPSNEPNSIDSLRTALSKAKPVSTPAALPPGMQLLNIGGQNVLLNTNTNPPVILQTSAPLNLNNLTLLAQLSAKAAAGNSLASKIVVNSLSTASTTVTSTVTTQSGSGPVTTVSSQPPQQVIRTLLAAGHASQNPKAQLVNSAGSTTNQMLAIAPSTTVIQQKQIVLGSPEAGTSSMVAAAGTSPLPTQLSCQSLLQQPGSGTDTRPQFYKYNDMSQMKATIRQQLVKTSQGLRTKSTVCTVPTGNTALSNLIQAGLLPQQGTKGTILPSTVLLPSSSTATLTTASAMESETTTTSGTFMPVKSENLSPQTTPAAATVSAPVLQTTVAPSVDVKQPSILSQVLKSATPAAATQANMGIQSSTAASQIKMEVQLSPEQQKQLDEVRWKALTSPIKMEPQQHTQQQKVIPQQQLPLQQQMQVQQEQPFLLQKQQPLQVKEQPLQQQQHIQHIQLQQQKTIQIQQQPQIIATPNALLSPNSKTIQSPLRIITSPKKTTSPTTPLQILPKGPLSPEKFKAAIRMGMIDESNIGTLIHKNPGFAKALNSTMRPKYASNVTVKSLLESRALRQKAQLYGDADTSPSVSPTSSLTVSPKKTVVSPVKVGSLSPAASSQIDKPVAIQIQNLNTTSQVQAAKPTFRTRTVSLSSLPPNNEMKTEIQLPTAAATVKPATAAKIQPVPSKTVPIQLQAVKTPQGTILRTLTGQQVAVRPAATGSRLQLTATPTGLQQQVVRLVSPPGTGAIQLVDVTKQHTPLIPRANIPAIATSTTNLDEVVKSVVTSVQCSIPPTPHIIAPSYNTTQPFRQVTMTTNTMKSPIPAVPRIVSGALTSVVGSSIGAELGQTGATTAKVVLAPSSTASGSQPQLTANANILSTASGTSQKNVVLRVIPGQQQLMTSQGLLNMVLPQQLLQQSIKADGSTGKIILQAGKGGIQLAQVAATQNTAASPIKAVSQQASSKLIIQPQIVSATTASSATAHGAATSMVQLQKQRFPQLQTTTCTGQLVQYAAGQVSTAQSNAKTITVYPPGHKDTKQPQVGGSDVKPHVQIKLVQQSAPPQHQPPIGNVTQTMVIKKDGTVGFTPGTRPPKATSAFLQPQRLCSPMKQLHTSQGQQSHIRVVSPAGVLSSGTGLLPTQVTSSLAAQVSTPQPVVSTPQPPIHKYIEHKQGVLLGEGMGEVTSSLDLLAAASMLQEAKAPLLIPKQEPDLPQPLTSPPARVHSMTETQPQLQQVLSADTSASQLLQQAAIKQETLGAATGVSSTTTTTAPSPLSKIHQQQAKVLEQQIKLQQQMLEEQQKQQKIIRQLTLQQEVALGGSPAATKTPTYIQPQVASVVPAMATSPVVRAQVSTTPTKTPKAAGSTGQAGGVQMAGVMASAGGRMVQLRFAVPAGMNVQQLLQTPQFQQQLAALKVSAIHGITTSTVTNATSTTAATTASVAATGASPVGALLGNVKTHTLPSGQTVGVGNDALTRVSPQATVHTTKPTIVTKVKVPVSPAATMGARTIKQVAGAATAKTLGLSQGATATLLGGQQQQGNKVTVLVNVNGQLVQAQGLSVPGSNNIRVIGAGNSGLQAQGLSVPGSNNIRVIGAGNSGLVTAQASAPKLMTNATGLPAANKMPVAANSTVASAQPRLLTSVATTQPLLTSPAKVVLQPQYATSLQKAGAGAHILVTRDGTNTIRLPVGTTLQAAAKTQLLSQLNTSNTGPGGLIITKPSNASTSVVYSTTATGTTQNINHQNGK